MLNLTPAEILTRLLTLVIAFTVHEFSHAWTANRLGDDTPRLYGRLTLNPLKHLDILGSIMLLTVGFGWAKPVPVNPAALRRRSNAGMMWVSLAGPLSNFLLAILAAVPLRAGISDFGFAGNRFLPSLPEFLFEFILINLSLMLFNLLPLAPLDGEKIALFLLPPAWSQTLERIQPFGQFILLGLFFVGPLLGVNIFAYLINPPLRNLLMLMGLIG